MFLIDVNTTIFFLVILNIIFAVFLTLYKSNTLKKRHNKQFILSKFLQTIAWILLGLRGNIPDLLSADLGNAFLFVSFSLEALAIVSVYNINKRLEILYLIFTASGILIFWAFAHSPNIRIGIASAVTSIIFALTAVSLFKIKNKTRFQLVIGFIYLIFCIFMIIRTYFGYTIYQSFGLKSPHIIQTMAFFTAFFQVSVCGIGYLLILREHEDQLLIESEEKYRTLVEKANEAIIIIQDENFVFSNNKFSILTGKPIDLIIGKNFKDFIFAEDLELIYLNYKKRMNGEIIPDNYDFRIVIPENYYIWVSASFVKIKWKGKDAILAMLTDISKRKTAEQKLQNNENLLKELNAKKDKFFSIIAHDLRGPFISILGVTELLKENFVKYGKEKTEHIINELYTASSNTYNLLENLLEWSRAQSDKIPYDPIKIDITGICTEIANTFYSRAAAKNIKLNYPANEKIEIFADINMLETIMRNLISNAIKFSNNNGIININIEEKSQFAVISISDNGIGIDIDRIDKIFDITQKQSTLGTANEKGTGLGLIICKEFVDKHGCKIWVESEKGKGSNFKFTMPLKEF